MGNTWTVHAWVPAGDDYRYVEVWRGESLIGAVRAMRRAKKTAGCVKLEWRG